MNERQVMQQLLSAMVKLGQEGSLRNLRQMVDQVSPEERALALELVAQAHLACFNLDARQAFYTVDHYYEKKDWQNLGQVFQMALANHLFELAFRIHQIGLENSIEKLQLSDFPDWFRRQGIKWFDLYQDPEESLAFIHHEDAQKIQAIVAEHFEPDLFWQDLLADLSQDRVLPEVRQMLLKKMALGEEPVVLWQDQPRQNVDLKFRQYCLENDVLILRKMQDGIEGVRRCSNVYLVMDGDGIIKIYKELLENNHGRMGAIFNNEDQVYEHIQGTDFVPRYYGKVKVDNDLYFIRMSYNYGQTLADYINPENKLSVDEAIFLVSQIAEKLQWLHDRRVLYLDIKPENIAFDGRHVQFYDFGISRILEPGQDEVDIFLADPRYGTPETGQRLSATWASDVWQLGVLFHQLLTGKHPFVVEDSLLEGDDCRESMILKYAWPNMALPYEHEPTKQFGDKRLGIISRMLAKDPEDRPSPGEIVACLRNGSISLPIRQSVRQEKRRPENNTVLFPARMGIPHRGHVEYIARLLELGFHVAISLQRSYTITERDPLPKWLVMKAVAQSLFERGYTKDDFHFIFTPFYATDMEMNLHFNMMPKREDIIAVASSNPGVHDLFSGELIFDQQAVFGMEGEVYDVRSWGEIIRRAVREDDYQTFLDYAPSGLEKIIKFDEIKRIYGQPAIDFVNGQARVILLNSAGQEILSGRAYKYMSPQESLARHLIRAGHDCQIIDLYSKNTVVRIDGQVGHFEYLETVFEEEDVVVRFKHNT